MGKSRKAKTGAKVPKKPKEPKAAQPKAGALEVQYVSVASLIPWDKNPRKNDKAAEMLVRLIAAHGFINPIVATPDGTIRAGHTRWKAAKKLGMKKVPVLYVDFDSEEEAEAYAISDNKSNEIAQWDIPALGQVVSDLAERDQNLLATLGFNKDELGELLSSSTLDVELLDLEVKQPPKMTWVLIGIPTVRFGDISEVVEQLAIDDNTICEISYADE